MQIVIDIPKEDYEGICHLKNEQLRMLPEEVAETLIRIANGTPLDKIRAEIEEHAKINQCLNIDRARALCWCLDVIDKYSGESEEQE